MRKKLTVIVVLLVLLAVAAFFLRGHFSDLYRQQVIPLAYKDTVEQYSSEYQIPPSVIYAIMKCESDFEPQAVSHAGAIGLMQIMPDTFTWLNRRLGSPYAEEQIADPEANIHVGAYYLSWLYEQFEDWELVYAAYNAGHNRVKRWKNEGTLYSSDGNLQIPIRETKKYVERVSHYRRQYLEHYLELKEKELLL